MANHGAHMWMCGAMVLVAVVLLATTGSAAAFLPLIACVVMMGLMMSMMSGQGRSDRK